MGTFAEPGRIAGSGILFRDTSAYKKTSLPAITDRLVILVTGGAKGIRTPGLYVANVSL